MCYIQIILSFRFKSKANGLPGNFHLFDSDWQTIKISCKQFTLWHVGENLQVKLRNWNKMWLCLFQSVYKLHHPISVLVSPASRKLIYLSFLRYFKNNSCQWLHLSVLWNLNFPAQIISDWKICFLFRSSFHMSVYNSSVHFGWSNWWLF